MNRGTCIHYNGVLANECCGAGVNYRQAFDDSRPGIVNRLPCRTAIERPVGSRGTYIPAGQPSTLEPVDRRGDVMIPCVAYREPTEQEIAEYREKVDAGFAKQIAALEILGEWKGKKPWRSRQEVIECPVCKGRLHVTQAATNGHVWAKCETANCVRVIE